MCVCVCDSERERANARDGNFDGNAEEECFWHEGGQRVIMMSLGVYSETDRGGFCTAPDPGDIITNWK